MMRSFGRSLAMLFGRRYVKPSAEEMTKAVKDLYAFKRTPDETAKRRAVITSKDEIKRSNKWRIWRWSSIIFLNLIFVLSYRADIQLVEGALTASRLVGFHMADLNSSLQVMLAFKVVLINLVIGTVTVLIVWWLIGGRTFCSWLCPYHLLSEFAEMVHLWLARRNIIRDHVLHRGTRTVLYVIFAVLAFVTGYTVFETISPVGILSRAFIYGASVALAWVGVLLLIEVFYSRRFWCRYICPIGLTYGLVGSVSPLRVVYEVESCHHEGDCRRVCMVPHVLDVTKLGMAADAKVGLSADCTRCGMCVDICPTDSFKYEIKGLSKLL